ncbi:membrane integrity-associated transporter subunit PqiC [Halieaceae bacterium IMCC14734]|uniref:Membrane integrity-associated transporter subunit PqiC n=1 Tax=Candidatus Litorirhabdus singularis TaxID=2518993 RepID=A0ABT3TKA6_9GAMM|nr:PqiC family protein [Candidatus Litorirhabdus singularis]MCX2982665.1 membrane integrity-associated transporter subunit PqiC [Candidatus Litorirhabdus singularis]
MRIILLLSLLIAGCSSQPVTAPEIYLLRSAAAQAPQATALAPPQVGLAAVTVADYLDQPGLVLETDSGTLHRARQHLWAEPLRTSLLRFMANEVGTALQAPVAVGALVQQELPQISIRIDQLHGSNDGAAVLVAYWEYAAVDGAIQSYRFTRQQALADDGYAALVAAEKSLLIQLAEAIAAALEG